jgi:DNA-directed RNA polymerase subunit beta
MLDAQTKVSELRGFLDKVYNQSGGEVREDLNSLTDDEIIELSTNLRKGVPMATQVFDGASEDEIKGLLRLAGLPNQGKHPCLTVVPVIVSSAM